MIPYIPPVSFSVFGSPPLHLFGILVALGVMVGAWLTQRRAVQAGFTLEKFNVAIYLMLIVGFSCSHFIDILFYNSHRISQEGFWVIFKFWDGMSSYGGLLGGALGIVIYCKWYKASLLKVLDVGIQGILVGMTFGRLGCTFAHDHMGVLTDFFLAVQYPGGARHNLGFYEFLYSILVLIPLSFWIHRKKFPDGYQLFFVIMAYIPVRFYFDLLREVSSVKGGDVRYWGLTPAQHISIVVFLGLGAWFLQVRKNKKTNKIK